MTRTNLTAPVFAPAEQCQNDPKWWSDGDSNPGPAACKDTNATGISRQVLTPSPAFAHSDAILARPFWHHAAGDGALRCSPICSPPAELAELDQWVVWRAIRGKRKINKVPYCPGTGRPADHSDPATWASYPDAARAAVQYSGLGFVFHASDPYVGIDLDDCIDDAGQLHPLARAIVERCTSYAEVSPSGRGVKIWVRGTLARNLGGFTYPDAPFTVELYSTQRYFAFTGQRLAIAPHAIVDAQQAIDDLVALAPAPEPEPEPEPARPALPERRITPGEAGAERMTLASVRATFNAEHSLEDLLRAYGAVERRSGWSCPCGVDHDHDTTLYISRQGRLFSYSPRCNWHTTRGWDAFGLYVLVEHHNDVIAALRTLNPPPERRPAAPREAPEYLTPQKVERRRQDAARKREARRQEAAERRAAVEERAAADDTLTPADRAVLNALLTIAGDRGWCRPSKQRLVELSGYSLGSVKRSLMKLEGRYIDSEGDGGGANATAVRTFLRGSLASDEQCEMIPVYNNKTYVLEIPELACEGGVGAHPGDNPDSWSWADPAFGPDDLAALAIDDAPAEAPDRAMVSYARQLARELGGAALLVEYDEMTPAELTAAIGDLEAALSVQGEQTADAQTLHGPDGAIATDGGAGAAWLPTDAARAWYDALPRPKSEIIADLGGYVELDPPADVGPIGPNSPTPRQVEPEDPAARQRYYALLGKAKKSGDRQAAALRARAAELLRSGPVRDALRAGVPPPSQAQQQVLSFHGAGGP